MAETKIHIYMDSAPFINLAKYKYGVKMPAKPAKVYGKNYKPTKEQIEATKAEAKQQEAEEKRILDEAIKCEMLLAASRMGLIQIHTCFLTVAECTHVGDRKAVSDEVKTFFDELLLSNEGGIHLIQPTISIIERARNLVWEKGIILRGADLIHVACALSKNCSEFLTGDGKINGQRDAIAALGLSVVHTVDSTSVPAELRQMNIDEVLNEHKIERSDIEESAEIKAPEVVNEPPVAASPEPKEKAVPVETAKENAVGDSNSQPPSLPEAETKSDPGKGGALSDWANGAR